MEYLVLACEGLRSEIDYLTEHMENPPHVAYLEQKLHNDPEKLRQTLQKKIDELENDLPDLNLIAMGYGLCGRASCGITSRRVRLIFPRVHDCIPLYLGADQRTASREQEDGVFWLAAGAMEYSDVARHFVYDRHRLYREKFGEARAAKMVQAENRLFANYKSACHIIWPELGEKYADLAKKFADEINLPYSTREGGTDFLLQLLSGPKDEELFLFLNPGDTLEMRDDGEIIAKRA